MTVADREKSAEFFALTVTELLTKDHLIDLAVGTAGAVRLKEFASPAECATVVTALRDADFAAFDRTRYLVPTRSIGPTVNHFGPAGELTGTYWERARAADEFWQARAGHDLRAASLARIAEAWGAPVGSARVAGRDVYRGIVRENTHGAPPHWDDLAREFPADFLRPRPLVQLAFNLYLSMPADGGQTRIWPRRWVPEDDEHRVGSCWAGLPLPGPPLIVEPQAGDALLFDPRNYHEVIEAAAGWRITLSFYLGITADGRLICWS